ncbi:MAG: hypothetical protein ACXW6R_20180 [Candidatus Binatia bacterium]
MECWVNPDKYITPVLQFFNFPAAIDTRLSYPLRHALRALLADLPVEQPMKFEFVMYLKTAKLIGVTIAPEVLARASKIIR